ncbi:MAG: hypothetical protein LBI48_12060, partial [Burkholderiaceae bacterium]|jgi:hypothetical protein|nr:hypothetical protein [Burkholderiaceae bacterium]
VAGAQEDFAAKLGIGAPAKGTKGAKRGQKAFNTAVAALKMLWKGALFHVVKLGMSQVPGVACVGGFSENS